MLCRITIFAAAGIGKPVHITIEKKRVIRFFIACFNTRSTTSKVKSGMRSDFILDRCVMPVLLDLASGLCSTLLTGSSSCIRDRWPSILPYFKPPTAINRHGVIRIVGQCARYLLTREDNQCCCI